MTKILGFDLGTNWGWAFYAGDEATFEWQSAKFRTLGGLESDIKALIDIWKPELVVNARAMGRNQQVIRVHGAMAGILELVCEKKGVPFWDKADSHMRKVVYGTGKMSKDAVMEQSGVGNEHAADAMTAAKYGYIITSQNVYT